MLRKLRSLAQKALNACGWQAVYRQDKTYEIRPLLRLGSDHIADSKYILGDRVGTVFDIGANVGQTAREFLPAFPKATIYSFEPDPGSFQKLVAATSDQRRVQPYNIALGREEGSAKLFRFKFDQTNSLLPKARGAEDYVADAEYLTAVGEVPVEVTSLDAFCRNHGIEKIDLLKVDTQGYELEVLNGSLTLLRSAAISLIYIEVCFVRYYEGQPLFPEIYQFLYDLGYRFVGLYESGFVTHCYHVGGNALFVHSSMGHLRETRSLLRVGPIQIRR
jgi:FkbM family methyltransferase